MIMNSSYDYLFKVVLVGDSGVGKSSLLLRFADGSFTERFISTIGVDFRFCLLNIDDKVVKLQIWDTAGQERFRTLTSAYYRGANGIMIIYDVTDKDSFQSIQNWLKEIQKYTSNDIQYILIGNKDDLLTKREVPTLKGEEKANEINAQFIETSAKNARNVQEAFENMARILVHQAQQRHQEELGKASQENEQPISIHFLTKLKQTSCCNN